MSFWERIANRVGALPTRRVTWGLVLLFSLWVLLDVLVFRVTSGLANSSYDAMVRSRIYVAAPDPRIVVVDIDEASLARMSKEFGRWPWPRDSLATVLDFIERQEPGAIVWDILFSDADRISPGGDAAFNEAVKLSSHSHFSVVRLPTKNDAASRITRMDLPGLWVAKSPSGAWRGPVSQTPGQASTVALIPPVLPAAAAGNLGFNNAYVDSDGVLRRFRYLEKLADGSSIKSLPLSVLSAIDTTSYQEQLAGSGRPNDAQGELIVWRRRPGAYPQVSFADVFAQAEGDKPRDFVPSFAGKIVVIGATAPSLYDIHPTPLSPMQAGVDTLATVLDNALHQRRVREIPRSLQAGLAIALCVCLAFWVQFRGASSLAPALLALPMALIAVSYLSLNGFPWFIDLHLAAGLALLFLTLLRFWTALRRSHWCAPPRPTTQPIAVWAWERREPWLEHSLDRLIDAVARHAPDCRVVACDTGSTWPATLRWPEFARFAAVIGPQDELFESQSRLDAEIRQIAHRCAAPLVITASQDREKLAKAVSEAWYQLQHATTDTP